MKNITKTFIASCALATMFLTVAPVVASAQEAQPTFRTESEGNWYHPVEAEMWSYAGGERAVIDATLAKIAAAKGERTNAEQPDTISAYGPGHWVYEWVAAGDRAMEESAAATDEKMKAAKAHAASIYYHTASAPHTNDEKQLMALDKAGKAYVEAGKLAKGSVTEVAIEHEGKPFGAYLHLPPGEGPFPVLVMSNGSDMAKETMFVYYLKHLEPKGIAMVTLDTPGMGDSRNFDITDGMTDKLHIAAADWARAQPKLDGKNIFVQGVSFGGNAAMRAWLANSDKVAGVIHGCGPLNKAFFAPPQAIDGLPKFTIDGIKVRLGLDPSVSSEELAGNLKVLSLAKQGLFEGRKIDTPILAMTTNADPIAPLDDLDAALARGTNVKRVVFDVPGHCMDHDVREAIASAWILDNLAK